MAILVPGQSGTTLDLYVKAGMTLYDPSSITFIVKDALDFNQGSGTYYGFRRSIGHYDASNIIIPTSGNLGTWSIVWTVGGATKTETFTVQQPTLTEIGDVQNAIDRLKQQVRYDIGDLTATIFTDYQLNIYLVKAVQRLNRELGISYKVRPTGITPGGIGTPAITPPISIDIDAGTIYPNTDEMKDLVVLQTEVLVTRAELSALRRASSAGASAAGSELLNAASGIVADTGAGIMVRNADGVTVDTTARYTSWLSNKTRMFLEDATSREKELADAIFRIRASIADNSSKVIY